jgi:hypothetical protein
MPRWAWQVAADNVGSRARPRAQVAQVPLRRLGRCRSKAAPPCDDGRATGAASLSAVAPSLDRSNTARPRSGAGQQATDPPFSGFSNDKKRSDAGQSSLFSPGPCPQEVPCRLGPMAARARQGSRYPQQPPSLQVETLTEPRRCLLVLLATRHAPARSDTHLAYGSRRYEFSWPPYAAEHAN